VESVAGLRDVLEDSSSPDHLKIAQNPSPISEGQESLPPIPVINGETVSSDLNKILFGRSNKAGSTVTSPDMDHFLLNVYHERVHALFKVLHWPSTLALFDTSKDSDDIKLRALKSAIYFTSVCSLLDHELEGRRAILSQYRQRAEEAFIDAGLLTTTSLMVLQAFVIYLVSTETGKCLL
jgi:hypothetical protein